MVSRMHRAPRHSLRIYYSEVVELRCISPPGTWAGAPRGGPRRRRDRQPGRCRVQGRPDRRGAASAPRRRRRTRTRRPRAVHPAEGPGARGRIRGRGPAEGAAAPHDPAQRRPRAGAARSRARGGRGHDGGGISVPGRAGRHRRSRSLRRGGTGGIGARPAERASAERGASRQAVALLHAPGAPGNEAARDPRLHPDPK